MRYYIPLRMPIAWSFPPGYYSTYSRVMQSTCTSSKTTPPSQLDVDLRSSSPTNRRLLSQFNYPLSFPIFGKGFFSYNLLIPFMCSSRSWSTACWSRGKILRFLAFPSISFSQAITSYKSSLITSPTLNI